MANTDLIARQEGVGIGQIILGDLLGRLGILWRGSTALAARYGRRYEHR